MARHGTEGGLATTELDPGSLRGLLDTHEREPKPTTVMRRDALLELVTATSASAASEHAVPRVLLEHRARVANTQRAESDSGSVSPLVVLAIIGVFIGMFAAIVLSA